MGSIYDMCVDNETLGTMMDKLTKIDTELSEATRKMANALQESQNFLAGNQFEKARSLTVRTVEIASNTSGNINNAINFLKQLREYIICYSSCQYKGGAR